MILRRLERVVRDRRGQLPAVALLGPRQVGKTTLAHRIAAGRDNADLDLMDDVMLARRDGGHPARALTSPDVQAHHSCV